MEVLVSGKSSFKIEVPYRLIETGTKESKPLIVYLHGYNQNMEYFQRRCKTMLKQVSAYHLFIQGPYPAQTTKSKNKDWGYAWYLYDGKTGSFTRNLEYTAQFIQEVIDNIITMVDINRICMFGYSMGGYQAGYFGLSRWKHTNELIVIGARIKTELFEERLDNLASQHILALHGEQDEQVDPYAQQEEIDKLQEAGVSASFKSLTGGHKLSDEYFSEIINWLKGRGYKLNVSQK